MSDSTETPPSTSSARTSSWNAYKAWLISNVVLLIICGPLLMGVGYARGWNTNLDTGKFEFYTVKDSSRFWPEPLDFEENEELDGQIAGRDFEAASGLWYYWKYRPTGTDDVCMPSGIDFDPTLEPHLLSCDVPQATAGTRAVVWICYLVHQCLIWGITYKAQKEHERNNVYHSQLRWYNVWSLIVNCIGYLAHLLQTHITYDGTAQDVTEASSQASVIMLLVMVLVMEYKNRGLILGWPAHSSTQRCWHFPTHPTDLIRKYHGYAFSWATIFTLWYHPMEPTIGHVLGFLHTGFLLIQQSLIFTPLHVNKYWRLLLECWVTVHGGVVAIQTISGGQWAMFLFGFLWMFVFTQIHGIPYYLGFAEVEEKQRKALAVTKKENESGEIVAEVVEEEPAVILYEAYIPTARWKRWLLRLVPVIVYFAIVLACYATILKPEGQDSIGMTWFGEIVRIPAIQYLLVLFTVLVAWGMATTKERLHSGKPKAADDKPDDKQEQPLTTESNAHTSSPEDKSNDGVIGTAKQETRSMNTALALIVFVVCYAAMVVMSVVFESIHIQMNLIVLMVVCVVLFTFLSLLVMIFQEQEQGRVALGGPKLPETDRIVVTTTSSDSKELRAKTEL